MTIPKVKKIPTICELAAHARSISTAFKIPLREVLVRDPDAAMARAAHRVDGRGIVTATHREVYCAPITDECTYAIAMHELGHHLHPTGMCQSVHGREDWRLKVLEEESAWEWAQANSPDWTVAMEHVKVQALESYRRIHAQIQLEAQKVEQHRIEEERLRAAARLRGHAKSQPLTKLVEKLR